MSQMIPMDLEKRKSLAGFLLPVEIKHLPRSGIMVLSLHAFTGQESD